MQDLFLFLFLSLFLSLDQAEARGLEFHLDLHVVAEAQAVKPQPAISQNALTAKGLEVGQPGSNPTL